MDLRNTGGSASPEPKVGLFLDELQTIVGCFASLQKFFYFVPSTSFKQCTSSLPLSFFAALLANVAKTEATSPQCL